jgi:hypothetical protein
MDICSFSSGDSTGDKNEYIHTQMREKEQMDISCWLKSWGNVNKYVPRSTLIDNITHILTVRAYEGFTLS